MQGYLVKYGYLDEQDIHNEDKVREAIAQYQRFSSIRETGMVLENCIFIVKL